MAQEIKCLFCMQVFTPKNSKARFCNVNHRMAYFRRQRKLRQQLEHKQFIQTKPERPPFKPAYVEEAEKWLKLLGRPGAFQTLTNPQIVTENSSETPLMYCVGGKQGDASGKVLRFPCEDSGKCCCPEGVLKCRRLS